MKLVIAGYYGCGNLGDEAILGSLVSGIRGMSKKTDITVLSGDTRETSSCYDVAAVKRFSFIEILRAIRKCDAFVLGGGGILQDVTSKRSLRYYLSLINMAKFFKKKIVLLGQGIGPIKNRTMLRRSLKNADLITVRDEASLKVLMDAGVSAKRIALAADLSFLMGGPDKAKGAKLLELEGIKKCKQRIIGVSLREPAGKIDRKEKYKAIASVCDHLIKEKDVQLAFLIFRYPDDIEAINNVMSFMKYPAPIMLRRCCPDDMLAVISNMDAVIGMRLHSLIFAAKAGIPSFGLSYDPKVAGYQRSCGQPWMDLKNMNAQVLQQKVDAFLESTGRRIPDEKLAEKAKTNITLLEECLNKDRIDVLGVEIDNLSMDDAAKKAADILQKSGPGLIVTPNPEIIMAAQKDVELKGIINNSALAPADGVGLMIAGRILGKKFKERVAGIDLMMRIIDIAKDKGLKIFLFGGTEGIAEQAVQKIGSNVAGTFHGYSMNDQLVIDKIRQAKPDILFVGLGSPRQEKWAFRHLKDLKVPLVMCIGGSLDVIAGKVKRAPAFMRILGLEWLYRLIKEPRRWRRMIVLPIFIIKVIRSRFGA